MSRPKHALVHSLEEASETLEAITAGDIDAVVVHGARGTQLYMLEGPDEPFRTFVERMQVGALTLTVDGLVLYANPYFCDLVGADFASLVGKPLARFVGGGYQSTIADLVRRGMKERARGECRLELDGGAIPVEITISPLAGGSCCALVFDLREREAAERAQTARIAAEEASRAKDRFLAVLSHELRGPLNTMLGWAQILASHVELDDTAKRAAEAILRSARTQANLIGDLLDISRIIAGKLRLEMTQLDLAALCEAVLALVEPASIEREVMIERRFADGDFEVWGDATRLQQIISNLVNNSLKFTEPGGRIVVSLDGDAETVVLRVRDSGIGMSAELVEHVFDAFHQGGTSERRKGGLGLGLAIAKQLAETHGGTLRASSEGEGKGSTFELRLPRAEHGPSAAPETFAPNGELAGMGVLVVDDDADTLELTRFVLERAGATVVTAPSAALALDAMATRRFDLLVTDIGMPEQDGFALMREIRARGFGAPAIAVTAYSGVYDARLASAAGFQRHLSKPVEAADLVAAAAELAGKKK